VAQDLDPVCGAQETSPSASKLFPRPFKHLASCGFAAPVREPVLPDYPFPEYDRTVILETL